MNKFLVVNLIKQAIEADKAGNYIKAKNAYQELYDLFKCELGEKHLTTLKVLNDLAIFYSYFGDYNKALEMNNAVYKARKEILGENHPDTLSALHNLANSYSSLGDYNKALEI